MAQRPVPATDASPYVTVDQRGADDGDRHQHRHDGDQKNDEPIHDPGPPERQDPLEPGRPVAQVAPGVLAQRQLEVRARRKRALALEQPAAIVDFVGDPEQHTDEIRMNVGTRDERRRGRQQGLVFAWYVLRQVHHSFTECQAGEVGVVAGVGTMTSLAHQLDGWITKEPVDDRCAR